MGYEVVPGRSVYDSLLEEAYSLRDRVIELTALRDDLRYHICPALQDRYEELIAPLERELLAAQAYLRERQRTLEILQAQMNQRKKMAFEEAKRKAREEYQEYQEDLKKKAREAQEESSRWRKESQWARHDEEERKRKEEAGKDSGGEGESSGSPGGEGQDPGRSEGSSGDSGASGADSSSGAGGGSGGSSDPGREEQGRGEEAGEKAGQEGKEGSDSSEWREKQEGRAPSGQRIKTLYRKIVKRLHPDTHEGELAEREKVLWQQAQEAYRIGDLERLEEIWEELTSLDDPGEEYGDTPEGIERLRAYLEKLRTRIRMLEQEIEEIRSVFPYTMKEFLEDEEAVKARQEELREQIRQTREAERVLSEYIRKLQEEMGA